jgi:hypothetical protein
MATTLTRKCRDLHDQAARTLAVLSYLWLVLFSIVLPHQGKSSLEKLESPSIQIVMILVVAIWIVYILDGIIFLLANREEGRFWTRLGLGCAVIMFPIFRISVPPFHEPHRIWLPFFGRRDRDRSLEKDLSRAFSLPMFCVVLLVLPILGIEYLRPQWLENPSVAFTLALGSQIIWLAFAFEFSLMISVARKKLRYCVKHWLDLAIILLPVILFVIPFLSFLPIARLARLGRLMRSTRLLRVKGVGLKAFTAMVLIAGTKRFGGRSNEKRIAKLKEQIEEFEEDIEEIRREIAQLERQDRERAEKELPA